MASPTGTPEDELLTMKAAIRLLKSRLRCHAYQEMGQNKPWITPLLEYEQAVEEDALQDWATALTLWGNLQEPDTRTGLVALIKTAFTIAGEETALLLNEPQVPALVEAYGKTFEAESLLQTGAL